MRLSPQLLAIGALTTIAVLAVLSSGLGGERPGAAASAALGEGKIVFDSNRTGTFDVWVMDPDGSNQTNLTLDQEDPSYYPRWSPDGTKIAYEVDLGDGDYDIWVMNADGSGKTGIAEAATLEGGPSWSPDGTKITFHDGDDVWIMNADGSGRMKLTSDPEFDCCPEWSPDGTNILFDARRSGSRETWMMNPDGTDQAILPGFQAGDTGFRYSPNGQMLTFYNDGDIYTMAADGTGRQQITSDDANQYGPSWTNDGMRILYTTSEFAGSGGEIAVMDADGSNRVNLSNADGADPDMQPAGLPTPSPTPPPPTPACPGATAAPGATCPPCPGFEPQGGVGIRSTCPPTPSPSPGDQLWGDSDCDGEISSRDNQALLRKVLSQNALSQTEPCPDLGDAVGDLVWGDWDCDGEISSRDNQALLRKVLSQNALSQTEPCPGIGDPVLN